MTGREWVPYHQGRRTDGYRVHSSPRYHSVDSPSGGTILADTSLAGEGWAYEEIKDVGTYGTIEENIDVVLQYHTNFYHFYSYAQS